MTDLLPGPSNPVSSPCPEIPLSTTSYCIRQYPQSHTLHISSSKVALDFLTLLPLFIFFHHFLRLNTVPRSCIVIYCPVSQQSYLQNAYDRPPGSALGRQRMVSYGCSLVCFSSPQGRVPNRNTQKANASSKAPFRKSRQNHCTHRIMASSELPSQPIVNTTTLP